MAKKNVDFSDADFILNYKPDIQYVPPPIDTEFEYLTENELPVEIEEARERTENLVRSYQALADLSDVAQKRIDNRVRSAGGVEGKTDPVVDNAVREAILRQFPEEDGTRITYDMYLEVLRRMQTNSTGAPQVPTLSDTDIDEARKDPFRTDFGGWDSSVGENRPELSSQSEIIKPVDINQFKESQIVKLLKVVFPVFGSDDD